MAERTPWWWRAAGHPATPFVLLGLVLVLGAPAFRVGLLFEDWGQRALLSAPTFDPTATFRLARDPEELRAAQAIGLAPWWSDPELRLAFLRPLSAWTHRLDWQWWPELPVLRVVHTFAWWALASFAAWRAYLRLLPSRSAAVLATFAWAADDARAIAVGWLANRNTLVAAAFGLGAVALHLRWRETRAARDQLAAVALLAAALFSAEAAVGAVLYLAVAAVVLESGVRNIGRAGLPYLAAVVPWVVVWKGSSFGAARSGSYFDPVGEPLLWLSAGVRHAPISFAAQWTGPLGTAWSFTAPPWNLAWSGLAVAVCAFVWAWARPLVAVDDRMRFAWLGAVASLLPIAAVFPSERVLAFVGFGASALLARALHDLVESPALRPRPWRLATRALALPALVLGPLALPFAIDANRAVLRLTTEPWDGWAEDDATLPQADVVSLTAPCSMCSGYLLYYREGLGLPVPRSWRVVAASWDRVRITRTGPRTLDVEPAQGFAAPPGTAAEAHGVMGPHLLVQQLDATFQSGRTPFPIGASVDVGTFVATVRSRTADLRPLRVELRFGTDLDDPSLRLVRYTSGHMVDVAPPAVGETVELAPEAVPFQ
jgi:hypothetical protein